MTRDVVHMVVKVPNVVTTRVPPFSGLTLRPLHAIDGEALGALMWRAYRGTVDEDDYNDPSDAMDEAAETLAGHWGPLIDQACLAATVDDDLVAAVVAVHDAVHDMTPLLAYVLTDPLWQRRGIGGWLIVESVVALAALEIPQVHLAVTHGNPAQRLYERLRFRTVE